MADVDPDSLHDMVALYVAGALSAHDRAAFESHVRTCPACATELRSLMIVAQALPYAAPQVDPPVALRDRVLAIGSQDDDPSMPTSSSRSAPARGRRWRMPEGLAVAALLIVSVGLATYALSLRRRLADVEARLQDSVARLMQSEQQTAAITRVATNSQAQLSVLMAPDVREVRLAGQTVAPSAAGRAFWSRARGLVFGASDLPPLPAGRTYQLWYLTKGAPVTAGVFKPDALGRAAVTREAAGAPSNPNGLAVSIEPEGGVSAPTGAIYLAGQMAAH